MSEKAAPPPPPKMKARAAPPPPKRTEAKPKTVAEAKPKPVAEAKPKPIAVVVISHEPESEPVEVPPPPPYAPTRDRMSGLDELVQRRLLMYENVHEHPKYCARLGCGSLAAEGPVKNGA